MIDTSNIKELYFVEGVTDFRLGVHGLVAKALSFGIKPKENNIIVFCNKKRTSIKIIHWETNGIWLYQKFLTTDKFLWIKGNQTVNLTIQSLNWLLQGLSPIQPKSYAKKDLDIIF